MLILMALTLVVGKDNLPAWLRNQVEKVEAAVEALVNPHRPRFGGTF